MPSVIEAGVTMGDYAYAEKYLDHFSWSCHFPLRPSLPKFAGLVMVGDEPDTCGLLTMALMHGGAEAKTSITAREAVRVLQQWKPDILVSDISGCPARMPRRVAVTKSGRAARNQLRSSTASNKTRPRNSSRSPEWIMCVRHFPEYAQV